jgi:hypothetical protein
VARVRDPAYFARWLPGALVTGVGVGMVLPSLSAAAVAHLPPARFGIGSAVNCSRSPSTRGRSPCEALEAGASSARGRCRGAREPLL